MAQSMEHFRGLLANVDSTILHVVLGDGFVVSERDSITVWERFPGLPKWEYRGDKAYVVERDVPQTLPQGPIIAGDSFALKLILGKLALLRLCKEGNPRLVSATVESDRGGYLTAYYPSIPDLNTFSVSEAEAANATELLSDVKQPFIHDDLQLAFENFQQSFEVSNWNLAFLALSISLEIMLSDGDQDKAYKVSRNAAVILSHDKETGRKVFDDVRRLYTKRSRLVHSGHGVTREETLQLRGYVRRILKRIISLDTDKKSLLSILDGTGFGEPLRTRRS